MSFFSKNDKFSSILVIYLAFFTLNSNPIVTGYTFSEELLIEALPNLNIHFNFQFKAISNESKKGNCKCFNVLKNVLKKIFFKC